MQYPWFLGGKRNKPGQSSILNMPLFLRQNIFMIFLQICPFSNISPLFSVSSSSTHGRQGKTESCYVSMLNISILYSIVFPTWNIHGLLENTFFFFFFFSFGLLFSVVKHQEMSKLSHLFFFLHLLSL